MKAYIDKLKEEDLSIGEAHDAMVHLFDKATPDEQYDFLVAMNQKEIAVSELAGFAKLPREEMLRLAKEEIPEFNAMIGLPQRKLTHEEMLNRDYYRGRFASYIDGEWIYNWEDKSLLYT